MAILLFVGRIALVAIFLAAGVRILMDIQGTADVIQAKFVLPALLADLAAKASSVIAQVESATRLPVAQIAAILAAVILIGCSVLVILNAAIRFACVVLALYVLMVIGYTFDWSASGSARIDAAQAVLKDVAILGGLLVLFVLARWRPATVQEDVAFLPRRSPLAR